jgi:hypothetical protein
MKLPPFSGPALPIEPPFYFKNMTSTVFPLRAQVDSLQRFCDSYLNIVPEQVGRFRASAPYVLLMVLDYGKVALQAKNLGWFAQREVMFGVPVEWYKVVDGQWVFHDWATVAPFIYVDDTLSMSLGRTLLGWPKVLVNLTPSLTGWIQDPAGQTTDAALSAMVLPQNYANAELQERVFLEIRSPMNAGPQVPLRVDSPWMPWNFLPNAIRAMSNSAIDYFGFLRGMGLLPFHQGSSLDNLARKAAKVGEIALPWAPNLMANTLNLKQFRRADRPSCYCFQALTNGPMRFTAFNRGGLLGATNVAAGDWSGGYTIDLTGWPSFPIVDTLGLQADIIGSVEGANVARLSPVFPFWYDVDMEYQRSTTIAWRTDDGRWRDPAGELVEPSRPALKEGENELLYNTTTGAAVQVVTGPFVFPEVTLRVLPLLAQRAALQALIDECLNDPLGDTSPIGERFDVWSETGADDLNAYVYLVATDWGKVYSETNDVGDWAEMGLTFYVPIKRLVDGQLQVGLFPALTFADGTTQACTFSELYGIPAVEAKFMSPPVPFSPHEPHSVLGVSAEILPTLRSGQGTRMASLVDIKDTGGADHDMAIHPSDMAESFCRTLRDEVVRKNGVHDSKKVAGRIFAFEMLARERPIFVYTMKQFRDGSQPNKACYQQLLRIPYVLKDIQQLKETERSTHVQIHEYPSTPIVQTLGLVTRDVSYASGAAVYTVEAVRPFSAKVALSIRDGECLYERAGMHWRKSPDDSPTPPPRVLLTTEQEELLSMHQRCNLKRSVDNWLRREPTEADRTNEAKASELLKRIDPQTILESILSREWEDRSPSSWCKQRREELTREFIRGEAGWGSWLRDNLRRLGQPVDGWDDKLVVALQQMEALLVRFDRLDGLWDQADCEQAWDAWTSAIVGKGLFETVLTILKDYPEVIPNIPDWQLVSPSEVTELELQLVKVRETKPDDFKNPANSGARRQCGTFVGSLLKTLHPIAEKILDVFLDAAVRDQRKPDHCVQRSTAGLERDRLFPVAECWEDTWYCGKPVIPSQQQPGPPADTGG